MFSTPRLPSALLALALLAACGGDHRAGRAGGGDTLYVGVAVGLTNTARYVNVFEGVEMALAELNASAKGGPVLAMRRAPAGARSVVAIAVAFRDDPSVVGVVGHTESAATITAAAIYADRENGGEHAIVAVSPTAGAPEVTLASEWVFRVCPTTVEQARAAARYFADSLGVKRVAVLYRNDPSGTGLLRAFDEELATRGGAVSERDPFTEDITEFDAYARRIAKMRTPGAMIAGNTTEERPFLRAMQAAGAMPAVIGTNPPEMGDTAAARDLKGMRFVQLYWPSSSPAAARFATAFRQRTGRAADRWAALGYDAAMLIGQAALAEHGDRHRMRDWIAGVGRARAAYAGATGSISFDSNRNPANKSVLVAEAAQ
ncbi:MAG: ABC transporter substrate-binding protein [Gemmatimonadaceae bacterium]